MKTSESVVLLVEDEPVLLHSMARGLSRISDIRILEAATLKEAMRLIREEKPHLIPMQGD